jgi:hypothetical protein
MAFHHVMLAPEEIRLVHRVFNVVIREHWFPRSKDNSCECAMLILHLYQRGIDDESELLEESRAAARQRFATAPQSAREPQEFANRRSATG